MQRSVHTCMQAHELSYSTAVCTYICVHIVELEYTVRYMHIYMLIDISTVPAMVYMRHASHLQAREQNGEHFVYSKLIVKRLGLTADGYI